MKSTDLIAEAPLDEKSIKTSNEIIDTYLLHALHHLWAILESDQYDRSQSTLYNIPKTDSRIRTAITTLITDTRDLLRNPNPGESTKVLLEAKLKQISELNDPKNKNSITQLSMHDEDMDQVHMLLERFKNTVELKDQLKTADTTEGARELRVKIKAYHENRDLIKARHPAWDNFVNGMSVALLIIPPIGVGILVARKCITGKFFKHSESENMISSLEKNTKPKPPTTP